MLSPRTGSAAGRRGASVKRTRNNLKAELRPNGPSVPLAQAIGLGLRSRNRLKAPTGRPFISAMGNGRPVGALDWKFTTNPGLRPGLGERTPLWGFTYAAASKLR